MDQSERCCGEDVVSLRCSSGETSDELKLRADNRATTTFSKGSGSANDAFACDASLMIPRGGVLSS